ncbi:hypothetical protein MKX01_019163 [Papaver californicum]|nr:hypothetical protein MKX01_019163 [Papaver californicum]
MEIIYVDWEEILILNEKGKREVHYFLKTKEGLVRDLAQIQMSEQHSKKFSWLGSSWTCHKRHRHYLSFCRNGITVHDLIYVLAEENKRLIAYLEDLYEDSRSNKMVVVRWFHKIDEVGIVLPLDFNDREIFFPLCLQDLSVECIDGLFQNQAIDTHWEPFMCHRKFENEDITTIDIAQVQGYWEQDAVRYLNRLSDLMDLIPDLPGYFLVIGDDDSTKTRPRKKLRRSNSSEDLQLVDEKEVKKSGHVDVQKCFYVLVDSSSCAEISAVVGMDKLTPGSYISVGCHVEVLSQDSGIRGCWFGGVVLKINKDKVKMRYQDVKDAIDEASSLEEWVSAARIAVPDKLGFCLRGRGTVRPQPSTDISLSPIKVGTSVDAWWHDGWWEGVVIHNESDKRVHVYFPERLCSRRQEGPADSKQLLQQPSIHISRGSHVNSESQISCENFLIAKSLKVDLENCKYGGRSVLKSSVRLLTNLVMSQ